MKFLSSLALPLCLAITLGILTGFCLYRLARDPENDVKEFKLASAASGGSDIAALSPSGAVTHSEIALAEWIVRAGRALSGGGLGFHPEIDGPDVFLALRQLTPGDFPLLMEQASRLAGADEERQLQEWILAEWARRASEAAIAWALDHRLDRYADCLLTLAGTNARAAWEMSLTNPIQDGETRETVGAIFSEWVRQNRGEALEALVSVFFEEESSIGAGDGFYAAALPDRRESPTEWKAARDQIAARILEEQEPSVRKGQFSTLLIRMAETMEGPGAEKSMLAAKREELAEWMHSLPLADTELATMLTCVAQHDGSTPDGAPDVFPWLWGEVPVGERAPTLEKIVEYWASENPWSAKDADACGRWLNGLGPLGPEYSGALKAFAVHAAGRDPESGLAWVQQIADPPVRAAALTQVQALILKVWPHRAGELGIAP